MRVFEEICNELKIQKSCENKKWKLLYIPDDSWLRNLSYYDILLINTKILIRSGLSFVALNILYPQLDPDFTFIDKAPLKYISQIRLFESEACIWHHDIDGAKKCSEECLILIGDKKEFIEDKKRAYLNLILISYMDSDYDGCRKYIKKAADLLQTNKEVQDDEKFYARALGLEGIACSGSRNTIDIAISNIEKAVNILYKFGELEDCSFFAYWLGTCYHTRCNYEHALKIFQISYDLSLVMGHMLYLAESSFSIGAIFERLGKRTDFIKKIIEAFLYFREIQNFDGMKKIEDFIIDIARIEAKRKEKILAGFYILRRSDPSTFIPTYINVNIKDYAQTYKKGGGEMANYYLRDFDSMDDFVNFCINKINKIVVER